MRRGPLSFLVPTSAPKPCLVCRALVHDGTSRCARHKVAAWAKRPLVKRRTGEWLQRERAAMLRDHPFCARCGDALLPHEAIRDHKVPLAEGGADDRANTHLMCRACHDVKSLAERLKGRGVQMSAPPPGETDPTTKFLRAQVLENFPR